VIRFRFLLKGPAWSESPDEVLSSPRWSSKGIHPFAHPSESGTSRTGQLPGTITALHAGPVQFVCDKFDDAD
jgi:hypothetical protein